MYSRETPTYVQLSNPPTTRGRVLGRVWVHGVKRPSHRTKSRNRQTQV